MPRGAPRFELAVHARQWAAGRHCVGRFARDERGVSAVFFGIMFAFLFLGAALAVDYGRATNELWDQQYALDAAILAASEELGKDDEAALGQARAERFFAANLQAGSNAVVSVQLNGETGEVRGTSHSRMGTTFYNSKVLGERARDHLNVGAAATAIRGDGKVEVALVVDNSGSMADYLDDLKSAASTLVAKVFAGADDGDKVKVGVVPFASSVNVGAGNKDSGWIDTTSVSPLHSENFSEAKSRFDLFDDLAEDWGGCVEVRSSPHDVTDTIAASETPASMFVPMFAPDEPDDRNASTAGYSNYYNNYISDYGGTCPAPTQVCVVWNSRRGRCSQWAPETMPVATAQSRVCKYAGAVIVDGIGPNYGCSTPAVLPLSGAKETVDAAIGALVASGNTNIGEGTMWGWRVLSPTAPFTEGRNYDEPKNKKILVIMTDGANTYTETSNHNESRYGAFGYAVKGRLGETFEAASYRSAMNTKLTTACANARAEGIVIFTVAFRLENDVATQTLLEGCATTTAQAFKASSGAGLVQAFEIIGKNISKLRVSG